MYYGAVVCIAVIPLNQRADMAVALQFAGTNALLDMWYRWIREEGDVRICVFPSGLWHFAAAVASMAE
jgi:hypothetical protein